MPVTSDVGSCAVCIIVFHVVQSSGVLRRHRHGGMCPPCAGSGITPAGFTNMPSYFEEVLNTAICNSLGSQNSFISDDLPMLQVTYVFSFPANPPRSIKRIPRAARNRAAIAFDKCLTDVVSIGGLPAWWRLLSFPGCLQVTTRSGRRHNLTSQVSSQIEEYVQHAVFRPVSETHFTRKPKVRKAMDEDTEAARMDSVKLSDGDVHRAIRILSSDSSYVPHD